MLAAWLLVGLFALPVSTLLLFSTAARRAPGRAPAALCAAAVAASAAALSMAVGAVAHFAVTGAALLVAATLAWWPATRRWGAVGHAAWGSAVFAGALYLAYMLLWTFRSQLGPVGTAGGMLLWLMEAAAYLLGLAYLWEMIDVLATARWSRRMSALPEPAEGDELPFVSLHVPAHNEPPDMVIETLSSLLALDYPPERFEIVMIDDNTEDPALWQPVADFAALHPGRVHFHHLQDWPGFKSGALNFALGVTDPRAEVVGVIDADYLADADYLRRCAPLFRAEAGLGFVQTPQDYRDWSQASYYRRLYYSYHYFFAVSQASRNERDGAIFGGTMGLIRRSALEQVGGWDEWCITEDAELSLRLLRAGWSGRHVETSFGRGVMPLTFEALKRQRFRWCFGGIQILRMHWRSLMPWDRSEANRLTLAQRWAYLSGALQWYGDLLGLAFNVLLLVATADLALGSGVVFRRLTGFLLVAVPALTALSVARSIALLRGTTGASWRDALGAFGIWLALGWTVAQASVRGALAPAGVFLRTPKTRGESSWADAIRANRGEMALAALGTTGVVVAAVATHGASRWLLPVLLLIPVLGQLAAPLNTVAALRAELPDELRRRRRTERIRAWAGGPLRPIRVAGVLALATATVAALFVILAPAGRPAGSEPNLLHEASGHGPSVLSRPATAPQPTRTTGEAAHPGGDSPTSVDRLGSPLTTAAIPGQTQIGGPASTPSGGGATPASGASRGSTGSTTPAGTLPTTATTTPTSTSTTTRTVPSTATTPSTPVTTAAGPPTSRSTGPPSTTHVTPTTR